MKLFTRVLYCLIPKISPDETIKFVNGSCKNNGITIFPWKINTAKIPYDCNDASL
jgi:hypothetical protein